MMNLIKSKKILAWIYLKIKNFSFRVENLIHKNFNNKIKKMIYHLRREVHSSKFLKLNHKYKKTLLLIDNNVFRC